VGVKVGADGVSVMQNSAAGRVNSVDQSPTNSVHFSVQLSSGVWHQVALGVHRRHVTLHVDCDVTATSPWQRRRHVATGDGAPAADDDDDGDDDAPVMRSSVVLSIGKAFIESSRYPRFEVSSLEFRAMFHSRL